MQKKWHMTLRIMHIMYNLNTCTEPLWLFVLCKMKSVTFKCDSKSVLGKPEVQTCFGVAVNFWMMCLIRFAWASFQKQSAVSLCWRDLLAAILLRATLIKEPSTDKGFPSACGGRKIPSAAGSFNHAGVLLNQGSLLRRELHFTWWRPKLKDIYSRQSCVTSVDPLLLASWTPSSWRK